MRAEHQAIMKVINALMETIEERVKDFGKRNKKWKKDDIDFYMVVNASLSGNNLILWAHLTREEIPEPIKELKGILIAEKIRRDEISDIDELLQILYENPLSENEEMILVFRIFPGNNKIHVQVKGAYTNQQGLKNPSPLKDFFDETSNNFEAFQMTFTKKLEKAFRSIKIKDEQQFEKERQFEVQLNEEDLPQIGGIKLPPNRRRRRGM